MSEETIQQEKKHDCCCKKTFLLVLLSLLLSIGSLATSICTLSKVPTDKKVVISTQYDKGKSLAKAKETKTFCSCIC